MISFRMTMCAVCERTISADFSLCGVDACINEDFRRGYLAGLEAAAKLLEQEHGATYTDLAAEIRKLKEKP